MTSDDYVDYIAGNFDNIYSNSFSDATLKEEIVSRSPSSNRTQAQRGLDNGVWDQFKSSSSYEDFVLPKAEQFAREATTANRTPAGYTDLPQNIKNEFSAIAKKRVAEIKTETDFEERAGRIIGFVKPQVESGKIKSTRYFVDNLRFSREEARQINKEYFGGKLTEKF